MTERIFAAIEPFATLEARVLARIARMEQENDRLARHQAKSDVYRGIYDRAIQRVDQSDMLSLEKAAEKMNLTPVAFMRKAERGQAVIIEIEDFLVVPEWTVNARGSARDFHLAIAREFAESGQQEFFKFMSYLKFMGDNTLEFITDLPAHSLKDVFRAVGITQGSCHVRVRTPMFEAADRALKSPVIMAAFINQLGAALTRIGGMGNPNEGGLSEEFLARYVPADLPHRDRWKREIP